jgi:hypothetical protein
MNDHQLAAALRATSPDAIAELYDAYGERLFRYCWSMLRNREMALAAVRDTLAVAQAYIVRLTDSESLGPPARPAIGGIGGIGGWTDPARRRNRPQSRCPDGSRPLAPKLEW